MQKVYALVLGGMALVLGTPAFADSHYRVRGTASTVVKNDMVSMSFGWTGDKTYGVNSAEKARSEAAVKRQAMIDYLHGVGLKSPADYTIDASGERQWDRDTSKYVGVKAAVRGHITLLFSNSKADEIAAALIDKFGMKLGERDAGVSKQTRDAAMKGLWDAVYADGLAKALAMNGGRCTISSDVDMDEGGGHSSFGRDGARALSSAAPTDIVSREEKTDDGATIPASTWMVFTGTNCRSGTN